LLVASVILNYLLLAASVLGIVYLATAIVVARTFARRRVRPCRPDRSERNSRPSITVLKPVSGLEPALYENLASFCDQDYPNYEVLFCLHDARDAAAPTIERVIAAFPRCSARILAGDDRRQRNPKIANLSKGDAAARGDVIVIADSDVRVGRTYLRSIADSFECEHTGAVSSLYRGIAEGNWVSLLGADYVEEQFAPSVLVAASIGRMRFCLGASMAVRRSALDAIGGIDALGPYLADDHKLGELVAARDYDVELSPYVVATTVAENTLGDLWSHELRWARTNLVLAPVGYAFSFLMFGVPLALLYLVVSRNLVVGLPVLAAAIGLRLALHYAARAALDVRERTDTLWLVPLRDALNVAIWFASFFGRSVRWRASQVTVSPDGQMR
jgi:ceramide glucosyltransferase